MGQVEALASTAAKVAVIRDNTVAHKIKSLSEKETFKKADITSNQIRDLINGAVEVVEALRKKKGRDNGVFDSDRFSRATLELLEAIDPSGPRLQSQASYG